MTDRPADKPRHLQGTPTLERLLGSLGGRLERLLLAHALGSLLLALTAWLTFAFLADWLLQVPHAVRWLHLGVLVALPFFVLTWTLIRPWRRRPGRSGLAVLIERRHPELNELLVSAVDLQESEPRGDSDEQLVARVLASAERAAAGLDLSGVLVPRRPQLRLVGGVAAAALLALAGLRSPELTRIFVERLLGGDAAWPQRTHLLLSIPVSPADAGSSAGNRLAVQVGPERIDVTVARGNDVPVLVQASGKVPDVVVLHLGDQEQLELASGGDGQFRTVLRSCQDDLVFYATGGDDLDGEPRVHLRVLDPPDVRGLALRITPPAYSGLAADLRFDRDVEVLVGSRLEVVALPAPPDARGNVRLLPEDRVIELQPRDFPSSDEGGASQPGLGFEFEARESLRLRFELSDDSGLENPAPGLFAVQVRPDRRPEIDLLSPTRGELDVVSGGALRLVVRASDDLGLGSLEWHVSRSSHEETWGTPQVLERRPAPVRMSGDVALERVAALAGQRVEVDQLAALSGAPDGAPVAEGEVYLLEALARDSRPPLSDPDARPDPDGLGRSGVVRLRVVSPDEFLRRLQDRLALLRTAAGNVETLQREKLQRVLELIAALESDSPESAARAADITSALTGQRRVEGDLRSLERELAGLVEGVLYARLDEDAGALLETLDSALAEVSTKEFDATPWRALVSSAASGSGSGLAAQLCAILDLALRAGEDEAHAASAAIDAAGQTGELEAVHDALLDAAAAQRAALTRIDELIARLAEWDNFQSVLNLARDILHRQKSLRDRTKDSLEGR